MSRVLRLERCGALVARDRVQVSLLGCTVRARSVCVLLATGGRIRVSRGLVVGEGRVVLARGATASLVRPLQCAGLTGATVGRCPIVHAHAASVTTTLPVAASAAVPAGCNGASAEQRRAERRIRDRGSIRAVSEAQGGGWDRCVA